MPSPETSRQNGKLGGRKHGYKLPKTLEKEAAREAVRLMVTAAIKPMITAQIAHATGIGHVYLREENGKFKRIENEDEIERVLTEGTEGEHYWIFAKDPSVQAFTDLMNRALDKPKEQPADVNVNVTGDLGAAIAEGRARAAARNKK